MNAIWSLAKKVIQKFLHVNLTKYATCEKLLGVKMDQHLSLDDHVKSVC